MKQQLNEVKRLQKIAGIIKKNVFLFEDISSLRGGVIKYIGPTEDQPYKKEIVHINGTQQTPVLTADTSEDEQIELANLLGKTNVVDQMFEPSQLADVLGYDSVKDLAMAIAEKLGSEFEESY